MFKVFYNEFCPIVNSSSLRYRILAMSLSVQLLRNLILFASIHATS